MKEKMGGQLETQRQKPDGQPTVTLDGADLASQINGLIQGDGGSENSAEERSSVSRRVFLGGAAAASAAAGLGILSPRKTAVDDYTEPKARTEKTALASYGETLAESTLVTLSNYIGNRVIKKILQSGKVADTERSTESEGIKVGNAGADQTVKLLLEDPKQLAALMIVVGPVIEEVGFRLIPSGIINALGGKNAGTLWEVGVPASLLFADAHNLKMGKDGKHADVIPLAQVVMGLFYWYLQRQRGFSHALSAHMFSNALLFGYMEVRKQFASKEEVEKLRESFRDGKPE